MKKRILILVIICAFLLALAMSPLYRRYIRKENSETCFKARLKICIDYTIATKQKENMTLNERITLLNQVCENNFGKHSEETANSSVFLLQEVCREGGEMTIKLNEDSNRIETFCSIEGHEECIWN